MRPVTRRHPRARRRRTSSCAAYSCEDERAGSSPRFAFPIRLGGLMWVGWRDQVMPPRATGSAISTKNASGQSGKPRARWHIRHADCLDLLPQLDPDSVDAIVTDPPYGLEFMGKDWDRLVAAPRGARTGLKHEPTIEDRNDTPYHRAAVKQPAMQMRCARCGGNSTGAWGHCRCEQPDFRRQLRPLRAMQEWHEAWAREALRVLKPGGHLLAFGGTRTYHRLACALEDAGFEVRDCIAWMYGSGFPKSLDVSKAIDKTAGVVGRCIGHGCSEVSPTDDGRNQWAAGEVVDKLTKRTAPATPESALWVGWGTALKPAHEPIVVARKPLVGTVSTNVLRYGTGAINIDACRIDVPNPRSCERNHSGESGHGGARELGATDLRAAGRPRRVSRGQDTAGKNTYGSGGPGGGSVADGITTLGRWPANVVLDEEAAATLDKQVGLRSGRGTIRRKSGAQEGNPGAAYGAESRLAGATMSSYGDAGGPSRFFYCAKASRTERSAGLDAFEKRPMLWSSGEQNPGSFQSDGTDRAARNPHPTVKPIDLMRWLIRLVTPPGGLVVDPFAGSGTTGCAAVLEDVCFLGIEREPDYVTIARARIRHWRRTCKEQLDR